MASSYAEPLVIKNYLRNIVEDLKAQMSVTVYNVIWDLIQSIDKDLQASSHEND